MVKADQEKPTEGARLNLTFEVQYFKPSGKFYTEGRLTMLVGVGTTGVLNMWEVSARLRGLQAEGNLPGINGKDWIIYVNHPMGGCPFIIPAVEEAELARAEVERKALPQGMLPRFPDGVGRYGEFP